MFQLFSFKKVLVRNILDNISVIYPGINQAFVVYYNKNTDCICSYEFRSNTPDTFEIDLAKYNIDIPKERSLSSPYTWLNNDSLTNAETNRNFQQLELGNEFKNNVLLLRIENPVDHQMDLIYMFMNKDMGIFKPDLKASELSTREKSLIGKITHNNLLFLKKQYDFDRDIFRSYNESFLETRNNVKVLQADLNQTAKIYSQSIIEYCQRQVQKITEQTGIHFMLSDEAIKKLTGFRKELDLLSPILSKAANIAYNTTLTSDNSVIIIEASDLVWEDFKNTLKTKESNLDNKVDFIDRFSRTREILDKYERGAQIAKQKGLSVTGKNIGVNCDPVISHPGIKDSLDKHQKKILTLFEEYPDKWPIIRSEFKSVINLPPRGPFFSPRHKIAR